jgi:hypothetical protein
LNKLCVCSFRAKGKTNNFQSNLEF